MAEGVCRFSQLFAATRPPVQTTYEGAERASPSRAPKPSDTGLDRSHSSARLRSGLTPSLEGVILPPHPSQPSPLGARPSLDA